MAISAVDPEWIKNAVFVTVGFSVFTFALMLMQEQEARSAEENLSDLKGRKSSDPFIKLLRPLCTHYLAPVIRGRTFWNRFKESYRQKIIAAGLKDELNVDEFISLKYLMFLFVPLIAGVMKSQDLFDISLTTILATSVLGWFYPNMMVSSKIKNRQKNIRKMMPFVVDLMALSTEAGLDLVGAMGKVVEKAQRSPLIEELEQVLREIRLGSSRSVAMREMSDRVNMKEIGSFISILISAEQMGASVGKVLRQQSDSIRSQRFVAAEKAGAKASSMIIFPVVFFIVPAVMLTVFGPFALSFVGGGGGF